MLIVLTKATGHVTSNWQSQNLRPGNLVPVPAHLTKNVVLMGNFYV